jgi:AbrB family looped-hinge helix DNA binding protein
MKSARTTSIDQAGRVVIPRDIRREVGFVPGTVLEVRVRNGTVELQPAPAEVDLVWEGGFLVAVHRGAAPGLTEDLVQQSLEAIHQERERDLLGP